MFIVHNWPLCRRPIAVGWIWSWQAHSNQISYFLWASFNLGEYYNWISFFASEVSNPHFCETNLMLSRMFFSHRKAFPVDLADKANKITRLPFFRHNWKDVIKIEVVTTRHLVWKGSSHSMTFSQTQNYEPFQIDRKPIPFNYLFLMTLWLLTSLSSDKWPKVKLILGLENSVQV